MSKNTRRLSKMEKRTKILMYLDSPTSATGFSTVSRNIAEALHKTGKYDIDIFGINYWGDPHNFPYRIFPAGTNNQKDPYGRQKFAQMALQMEFDILFLLQDTFILNFVPPLIDKLKEVGKKFKSICYYPIDGRPKAEWINNVNQVDYLVTYTEYAKKMSEEIFPAVQDTKIIYHGANVKEYFPVEKAQAQQFKERYLGVKHKDKFVVTNINRNQQRKDIPRTIAAFKEFKKQVPDSLLYLHMAKKDQGWNLEEVVRGFGLTLNEDVIFPENFNVNQGYPREFVNMIYNMSDLIVSTTTGEGFGLSWIEAMATKTPVLMPNNTAMTEFITEERGYLSKSQSDSSQFIVMPNDNDVIRPLVDVDDMVKQMLAVYNDYDEAMKRADAAYDWVHVSMDWQGTIGRQWVSLFNEARQALNASEVEVISAGGDENIIEAESF